MIVLLTANEDVGSLHPAITRPDPVAPAEPATLAELSALREQRADTTDRAPEIGGYL